MICPNGSLVIDPFPALSGRAEPVFFEKLGTLFRLARFPERIAHVKKPSHPKGLTL
jgi:hypothetical protein